MGAYLSSPNTEKDLEDSDAHNTVYGAASMQGWRTSQEDAHNCCPDFDAKTKTTLFAVYDGHGGSEVAQYCAIHLPDFIRSTEAYSAGDLGGALKDAFLDIDSKLTSAEVVQELKAIAGLDDDDDDDPEQGDEIAQLRLEAVMPISELMKRYSHDKKEAGSSGDGAGKKQRAQLLSPVTGSHVPNGHGVLAGKLATSSSSSGGSSRQAEAGRDSGDAAGMQEGEDDDDVFTRGKARHGAAAAADVHGPPGSGSSSGGGGGDGGGAAERPAGTANSSLFASSSGRGGSSNVATEHRSPAAATAAAEVDDAGCSSSTADAPDASSAAASVAGLCDSSSEASEAPASGPTAMSSSKADAESGKSGDGSSADEATVCSSSKRPTDLVELPPMCSAADSDSLPSSSGLSHTEDAEGPSCSSSSRYKPLKDEGGSDDSESDGEESGEAGEEDAWSSNDDDDDEDDCDDDDADGDGEGDEDDADDDDDNDENEGATLLRKHMALARTLGEDNEAPGAESGCTACVALIRGGSDIYVANAGDSRCVLSSAGRAIDLSCDHKPDDAHETARIKRAGGHITQDGRVNGGLNLSRAIGDHAYKRNKDLSLAEQMISASPDIMHHKITADDEFLIIACDGIWNSMSSQEVVNFVRERLARPTAMKLSEICSDLFDACLSEDTLGDGTGCDNMTCIIVKLPGGSDRQQQQAGTAAPKRRDGERADDGGREGKRPRVADDGSGCPAPQ